MIDEDQIRRWEDEGGTHIEEERTMTETNVHTEHCCSIHGCKYGDENCPVVTKEQNQSYLCEACEEDGLTMEDVIETLLDIGVTVVETAIEAGGQVAAVAGEAAEVAGEAAEVAGEVAGAVIEGLADIA